MPWGQIVFAILFMSIALTGGVSPRLVLAEGLDRSP